MQRPPLAERFHFDPEGGGVRELVATIERQSRLAACLENAVSNQRPLPRSAGLGDYLKHLKCVSQSPASGHPEAVLNRDIAQAWQAPDGKLSPKNLRDYLSHGGTEPDDEELLSRLLALVTRNWESLDEYMVNRRVSITPAGITVEGGQPVPLIFEEAGGTFYFQEHRGREIIFYGSENHDTFRVLPIDDPVAIAVAQRVDRANRKFTDRSIEEFEKSLREDVRGFAAGEDVYILAAEDTFDVSWRQKTSVQNDERLDKFRLSNETQRQWHDGASWVPYGQFLKEVCNWPLMLTRLRQGLTERLPSQATRNALPAHIRAALESAPTRYMGLDTSQTPLHSNGSREGQRRISLPEETDNSASQLTRNPNVFFVTGEAGIGKTHNLTRIARERLDELIESDTSPLIDKSPAYLYVSCSSVGAIGIEAVIKAAISNTFTIDFEGVMALCRNGLLIPVTDGFDELLGGASYRQVGTVLKPIFDRLGTSGTLIISARSAYLANQYRFVLKSQETSVVPIDHRIVLIGRWDTPTLDAIFGSEPAWSAHKSKLSKSDRDLLGVPFFTQIFATLLQQWQGEGQSVRRSLITEYLRREIDKMKLGGGDDDVSETELWEVFTEVSGMMLESGDTALTESDFLLSASQGLNRDLGAKVNSHLADRMTVLCGISSETRSTDEAVFTFEHELFLEQFMAFYLHRSLATEKVSAGRFSTLMNSRSWGSSTTDALADLEGSFDAVYDRYTSLERESVGRNNAAELFAYHLARHRPRHRLTFSDLPFLAVRLDDLESGISFQRCTFETLRLPDGCTTEPTTFESCSIEILQVAENVNGLGIDFSRTRIDEIHISSLEQPDIVVRILSNRLEILHFLTRSGFGGVEEDVLKLQAETPSEEAQFAEALFRKMSHRQERIIIVEKSSRQPGSTASSWVPKPYDPAWTSIVVALESNGLAELVPLNAGGTAKWRVALKHSVEDLLARDSESVLRFWHDLQGN